jgi:2-polyprenyl-6-methoxyphenol hydroxylase-like FAD-dependent oxidoreductase
VLDDYARVRRPVAERVVSFTDMLTRMATVRKRPARMLRNLMLRTVSRLPAVQRRLTFELSGLGNRGAAISLPAAEPMHRRAHRGV